MLGLSVVTFASPCTTTTASFPVVSDLSGFGTAEEGLVFGGLALLAAGHKHKQKYPEFCALPRTPQSSHNANRIVSLPFRTAVSNKRKTTRLHCVHLDHSAAEVRQLITGIMRLRNSALTTRPQCKAIEAPDVLWSPRGPASDN